MTGQISAHRNQERTERVGMFRGSTIRELTGLVDAVMRTHKTTVLHRRIDDHNSRPDTSRFGCGESSRDRLEAAGVGSDDCGLGSKFARRSRTFEMTGVLGVKLDSKPLSSIANYCNCFGSEYSFIMSKAFRVQGFHTLQVVPILSSTLTHDEAEQYRNDLTQQGVDPADIWITEVDEDGAAKNTRMPHRDR